MKKGAWMKSLKKLVNSFSTPSPMTIIVNDEKTARYYPLEEVGEFVFGGTIPIGVKP